MEKLTKICTKCNCEKELTEFYKDKTHKDGFRTICKICTLEYKSIYRINNIEKIKELSANSYIKHREERIKKVKIYAHNNKEKVKEKNKIWRSKNKDLIRQKNKEYKKTENGKILNSNYIHKRRTLTKDGDVTNQQLKELYQNTKTCYWCNSKLNKGKIHLDHYHPLSKGGQHTISNLVLSCSKCNLTKGSKDPIIFAIEKGRLL